MGSLFSFGDFDFVLELVEYRLTFRHERGGTAQGPRLGSFIALYGIPETIALIKKALAGELAN